MQGLRLSRYLQAFSSNRFTEAQIKKTANYTLEKFEDMAKKQEKSIIARIIMHRILDRRNKAMFKNIVKLANHRDNPVVVMVGAMHAPYLELHLKENNMDVTVNVAPRAQKLLDISTKSKEAIKNGATTEEEKMWITKTALFVKAQIVQRDNALDYVDGIWSLKTRQEALNLFDSLKSSKRD